MPRLLLDLALIQVNVDFCDIAITGAALRGGSCSSAAKAPYLQAPLFLC